MRKQPNVVIKIATLLSSLLLVGGCVSYRGGMFDAIPETMSAQNTQAGNQSKSPPDSAKTTADTQPADPAGPNAKKTDPVIFYGTKAPFNFSINETPK